MDELRDAIASKSGTDRKAAIAVVNAVQERMDVELEVAALVAAYRMGVDVKPILGAVKARVGVP